MEDVKVKVAKLEEQASHHDKILTKQEKRLEKVEDSTAILHRMEVILENQVETNREQSVTLKNINENLTHLNQSYKEIKDDVNRLDKKVEKVEKAQEEDKEKNTIDVGDLPKRIILWCVGLGLTVLTAWVLIKLGLK